MPNGTYGGVRGRKTKVGRKLSFSSYSIPIIAYCASGSSIRQKLHPRKLPRTMQM